MGGHLTAPVAGRALTTALFLWLLGFLPTLPAAAETTTGIEFLLSGANPDGSWGAVPERDTGQVLRALKAYETALDPSGIHESYLAYATTEVADFDTRLLLARAELGEPVSGELSVLLSHQNTDGGFGFQTGLSSGAVETALALRLMAEANYSNFSVIVAALNFLVDQQQPDGGFAYEYNASSVPVTVVALEALVPYRTVFNLSPYIQAALSYLYSTQQTDGHFGTDSHAALTTAMALTASAKENVDPNAWTRGADYLSAAQQPSSAGSCGGSWDCDPYTTAWAVLALGDVLPDLVVDALDLPGVTGPVPEGTVVQAHVVVRNSGKVATAAGAAISLSLGNPTDGSVAIIGQATLPALSPGSSHTLTLTWDTTGVVGSRYIGAVADSTSQIKESDEQNNVLWRSIQIQPKVDLSISTTDLAYSPDLPTPADTITFKAQIHNTGGTAAENVKVQFVIDPAGENLLLSEQVIALAAGASSVLSASTVLDQGSHELLVLLDPDDTIAEGIETNNSATLSLEVGARVDLRVSSAEVLVNPTTVAEPEPVKVSWVVHNDREGDALNVRVRLSTFNPGLMESVEQRAPLGPDQFIPAVPAYSSQPVSYTVSTAGYPGTNYLIVEVDPLGEIAETDEDNNSAQGVATVTGKGNLNITANDLILPATLVVGQTTILSAKLRNNGGSPLSDIQVQFTATSPAGQVLLIGNQVLPTLNASAGATVSQSWSTRGLAPGNYAILVTLDPDNTLPERDEADNSAQRVIVLSASSGDGTCKAQPPFTPSFEPELEWEWTGSSVLPDYKQVMMTPVVVDVNQDGIPDVVFNSYRIWTYPETTDGVLRAISGNDGHDLWSVTDPAYRVDAVATIAAGDIDADGKVEICTIPLDRTGIICFENDGSFKFRTNVSTNINYWGGLSFADIDGDGNVEILNGNHVYDHLGNLLWIGSDGMGGINYQGIEFGPISFAVDLDQNDDGKLEVINDRAVYEHDGTLKWRNTNIGHGLAAVGNFDADPAGEVVMSGDGFVTLLDDNGTILWRTAIPGGGNGGAPNIADFDNDGQPEVGVAGANAYSVFETNGTVKWSSPTQDLSSHRTGSSTFDFEGDGKSEVVYADELYLRIYDGATGAIRFKVPNSSGTTYENPVIADVDGDGNAEIVVAANDDYIKVVYPEAVVNHGIRVYRDRNDGWVNTRSIWNQHAYSVTNVNDDGSIPTHQVANWLKPGLNTFRSNSQGTSTGSPIAAPDLEVVPGSIEATCIADSRAATLEAQIRNGGDSGTSAGLEVAFYEGDPETTGTLLGIATVTAVIPVDGIALVSLVVDPAPSGLEPLFVVADDNGHGLGRELECNEKNNSASADVDLSCAPNTPPSVQDQTIATLQDTPVEITLTGTDADGDLLTWIGLTYPAHGVLTGAAPHVTYIPSTHYTGPDSFTYVASDGKATSPTASVTITVSPLPDALGNLNVTSSDFNPPSAIIQGQSVTLATRVRNNGGSTLSDIPVQFSAVNTSGETTVIGTQTISSLPAGSTVTTPGLTWNTTGLAVGGYSLIVTADPENAIPEKLETDNVVTKAVTLIAPQSSRFYTYDADFDRGAYSNVVHSTPDQLQLDDTTKPFNFIWVAVSSKGTTVKINTETGQVLGEYHTAPEGQPTDPSRTTVDLNGNVWNTNRAGHSVVHIGLVENNQCEDRNGNGVIDTSTGLGDVLRWRNTGGVDTDGGVETAEDECILHYVLVHSYGTRHVSVNKDNDVWVSGTGNQIFDLIDGDTGRIIRTEGPVGYGGYGGLIDGNEVIWSANPLLRWDTALPLSGPNGGNWTGYSYNSYGLCIDSLGSVWNTSYGEGVIRKYDPRGTLIGTFGQGKSYAQGCAVDQNDDVWVAHSLNYNTVGHLKNDGRYVGTVTVGSGPTGVAVDAAGKVWATNYGGMNVSRIDPTLGPLGADGVTHIGEVDFTSVNLGGNLYNYSDMTGSSLQGAPRSGTWTVVYDSGVPLLEWGTISWTANVPGDGELTVTAASSEDGITFGSAENASNGDDLSVANGRYLKISVIFSRATTGESPILYDLSIGFTNEGPSVSDQTVTTQRDTPVDITLTGTDPNSDPLTWIILTSPAHGALTGEAPHVTYTPAAQYTGPDSFTYVAYDGQTISQAATASITVTDLPDLIAVKLEPVPGAPLAGETVTLTGTVANAGLQTCDAVVQLYEGDVSTGRSLAAPFVFKGLEPGSSRTFSATWLALSGDHLFTMVVDPGNAVLEFSETNNMAQARLVVPGAASPELAVSSSEFTAAPQTPSAGTQVTLTARIHNLGTPTSDVLVQFYDGDPLVDGRQIGSDVYIPQMDANSYHDVSVAWNSAGQEGSNTLLVWVDPLDRIAETREDNNKANLAVEVTQGLVELALSTDAASYGANSTVHIIGTVRNRQTVPLTGAVALEIQDAGGNPVASLGTISLGTIPGSGGDTVSTTSFTASWNTQTTLAGAYQVVGVVLEDGHERVRGAAAFTIEAERQMLASVTTDRLSYSVNEIVEIRGLVSNETENAVLLEPHGTVTILSPDGSTVFSESFARAQLNVGEEWMTRGYWNIGTAEPGVYTVGLGVVAEDNITASASTTFTVLASSQSGLALAGVLTIDPPSTNRGKKVTLGYRVGNEGNAGLESLPLQILITEAGTLSVVDTVPLSPVDLDPGASVAGSEQYETSDLKVTAYRGVLQAEFASGWVSLALADLTIEACDPSDDECPPEGSPTPTPPGDEDDCSEATTPCGTPASEGDDSSQHCDDTGSGEEPPAGGCCCSDPDADSSDAAEECDDGDEGPGEGCDCHQDSSPVRRAPVGIALLGLMSVSWLGVKQSRQRRQNRGR